MFLSHQHVGKYDRIDGGGRWFDEGEEKAREKRRREESNHGGRGGQSTKHTLKAPCRDLQPSQVERIVGILYLDNRLLHCDL